MPDLQACAAFETFAAAPYGDVGAARDCARALLARTQFASEAAASARALLCAVLLHLRAEMVGRPTLEALSELLRDLSPSRREACSLTDSPNSLVLYAAAELVDGQFDSVLAQLPALFVDLFEPTPISRRSKGSPTAPNRAARGRPPSRLQQETMP